MVQYHLSEFVFQHFLTERVSHLQHVLDGIDGGVQQGGDPLVIVGVVGVPQTHEENESRQTWDQIHRHTSGFEFCG